MQLEEQTLSCNKSRINFLLANRSGSSFLRGQTTSAQNRLPTKQTCCEFCLFSLLGVGVGAGSVGWGGVLVLVETPERCGFRATPSRPSCGSTRRTGGEILQIIILIFKLPLNFSPLHQSRCCRLYRSTGIEASLVAHISSVSQINETFFPAVFLKGKRNT